MSKLDELFLIICCIIALIIILMIFLIIIRKWLPKLIVCDIFAWHYVEKVNGFDGISPKGKCIKCNKSLLQDSQGNWF